MRDDVVVLDRQELTTVYILIMAINTTIANYAHKVVVLTLCGMTGLGAMQGIIWFRNTRIRSRAIEAEMQRQQMVQDSLRPKT